jgi:hypothetical protein
VAAELAHNAVPIDAAANVGNDVYANAVGPTDKKPNAVVETTNAERRALESSARLDMVDFCGGSDVAVDESVLSFVASCMSRGCDAAKLLPALFSSFEVVEEKKNEL